MLVSPVRNQSSSRVAVFQYTRLVVSKGIRLPPRSQRNCTPNSALVPRARPVLANDAVLPDTPHQIEVGTFEQRVGHQRKMVGERGFEPPAPASRRQCSTRLSYSPDATVAGIRDARQGAAYMRASRRWQAAV